MSEEFIEKILANEEGQTFECKRVLKKPSDVLPAICAFANADGGLFVYGIADKKQYSGKERLIGISESPGWFPGFITPETILGGRFARNPIIERTLKKMPNPPNLDIGEGVDRMFREMYKKNLYYPLYFPRDYTPHSVCVILFNEEKVSYWDMVEKYLAENPSISNKQFREISGLDTLKASELLKRWTKQQLLEKIGMSKRKMAYRKPATRKFGREALLGRPSNKYVRAGDYIVTYCISNAYEYLPAVFIRKRHKIG